MVQLSMQSDYSLYPCEGVKYGREEEHLKRFSDNVLSDEDEAVWDETMPYYYEPVDWSIYNWEERDDPYRLTMNANAAFRPW